MNQNCVLHHNIIEQSKQQQQSEWIQIPPELFCFIFEFISWNEAHAFATQVNMKLYRKLMFEDRDAHIYRMFFKRLLEREAKLLLERLNQGNNQVMRPSGTTHSRSLSQLRNSVRKFLKTTYRMFPDLCQMYGEQVIAAVDRQALKLEEERQSRTTPSAPSNRIFTPPKSLKESISKCEKRIVKPCNWKKALQGHFKQHKLLELDILLHSPLKLNAMIEKNRYYMMSNQDIVQQIHSQIIETFSRIELLTQAIPITYPGHVLYSERLKFGALGYNIFFSLVKLVLDSHMITLIQEELKEQQQRRNEAFVLRIFEFFVEAYFNSFGHYNVLIEEPYEDMNILVMIVQLKSPQLLLHVFQKYGAYLSEHMTNRSKVTLVVRFIRHLIPMHVVKTCLLEHTKILCSELICDRKLYPFQKERNIIHYLVGINGKCGFDENDYFKEWIHLVETIIDQAYKSGKLQESTKTQLLKLFGEKNSSNFSPIEYLQYNVYRDEKKTSHGIIFKEFIERKIGVHIRLQFKNLQDKYCSRFTNHNMFFSSRRH